MPADHAFPYRGEPYRVCVLCGHRGLVLARITFPPYSWVPRDRDTAPFPAGAPCCKEHRPVPAARVSYRAVIGELAREFGDWRGWGGPREEATLERLGAVKPGECPACAGADLPQQGFYTNVLAFDRGIALVGICEHCRHTTELGRLGRHHG